VSAFSARLFAMTSILAHMVVILLASWIMASFHVG